MLLKWWPIFRLPFVSRSSAWSLEFRRRVLDVLQLRLEKTTIPNPKYAAYKAASPYFDLVRGALGDLVDGEHFFDILTHDVMYEVLYAFPGWPRIIQGRADLMTQFKGYC